MATKSQTEHLRKLYSDCGLLPEDIRKESRYNKRTGETKEFVLITRTGIEKIIQAKHIVIDIEPVFFSDTTAVVKVTADMLVSTSVGSDGFREVYQKAQTLASANKDNCKVPYYAEMAEKRGIARAVIKITAGAESGLMSDDELDDSVLEKTKPRTTSKTKALSNAEQKLKSRKTV
jgi:hypothetical protein